MSEPIEYAQGGYVGGGPVPVWIHPEECLLMRTDDGWVCVRPDHKHTDEQEDNRP